MEKGCEESSLNEIGSLQYERTLNEDEEGMYLST